MLFLISAGHAGCDDAKKKALEKARARVAKTDKTYQQIVVRLKTALGVSRIEPSDILGISSDAIAINKAIGNDPAVTRKLWNPSRFTHPKNHDPSNFRYIVVVPAAAPKRIDLGLSEFSPAEQAIIKSGIMPNVATDPRLLAKRQTISASVISNEFARPIDEAGVILRVPEENIYFTSVLDMGQNNIIPQFDAEAAKYIRDTYTKEYGIISPEALIAASVKGTGRNVKFEVHNEIGVTGETQAGKIEVVGVFINEGARGKLAKELPVFARENNLPVVQISTPRWP